MTNTMHRIVGRSAHTTAGTGTSSGSEERVLQALADERWDFRKIDGIARSTGLSATAVAETLTKLGDRVRCSYVPDAQGRPLYTLASRQPKLREQWATLRAFAAKST